MDIIWYNVGMVEQSHEAILLAGYQALWRTEAQERGLSGRALETYVAEQQSKYEETRATGRHFPGNRMVTPGPEPGTQDTPASRAARVNAQKAKGGK